MTTNARRIAAAEARPGHRLALRWQDGGEATVDLTGVVKELPYFAPLRDEAAFAKIEVVAYGTGVEWANGIDYSADSLEVLASEQDHHGQ